MRAASSLLLCSIQLYQKSIQFILSSLWAALDCKNVTGRVRCVVTWYWKVSYEFINLPHLGTYLILICQCLRNPRLGWSWQRFKFFSGKVALHDGYIRLFQWRQHIEYALWRHGLSCVCKRWRTARPRKLYLSLCKENGWPVDNQQTIVNGCNTKCLHNSLRTCIIYIYQMPWWSLWSSPRDGMCITNVVWLHWRVICLCPAMSKRDDGVASSYSHPLAAWERP